MLMVGEGGFGCVYRGTLRLPGGHPHGTAVAVKRLNPNVNAIPSQKNSRVSKPSDSGLLPFRDTRNGWHKFSSWAWSSTRTLSILSGTDCSEAGGSSSCLTSSVIWEMQARGETVALPKKKESEACEEQKIQVSNKKRPRGNASESLRSKKAARTTEPKVSEAKRNYKSKMSRRRNSPIASGPHVSGSSMVNMLARRNTQSKLKSPSSNAISPIHGHHTPASLHDLSPAPPRGDSPDSFHDRLAPTPTHGSKRRSRKLTSIIWKEAEPIYIGGFLMQGRCNYCNTIFPASKLSGTSQLARHLRLCDVKCAMDGVVKQIRTSEEIDPDWRFDQESARVHLVNLVVLHGLPFSFVEYSGFRKFCTALNPWFKSIRRVTVQNDCIEAYKQFKSNYQLDFKNFDHRVSLTGDMWTSNQKLGYLCLTCHWIDSKWKVQHRIIQFCLVETPHDSSNMFDVVLDSLRTWNIENKICSLTMDNAEVNTKMISHLRANLVGRDLIHHKGKLLHIRCAAHVLNLIVQDGLKTMGSVVDNIRNSVKYIRSSQHRIEQFDKMVVQEGIKCKHQPSLDVSTRWNSTFLMLESTLPFRKVFETLEEQEPSYTFGPSDKEWEMVVDICKLLKVFCRATNVISGSNYPTANLYFLEIWSVKVVLDEQEKSTNDTIRIMVKEMKLKFHKYFMESYLTNCIPVILDPRFKIKHVEFRLNQYFGPDAHTHIIEVKQAMAALFLGYASESNGSTLSQEENDEEAGLAADVLTDWDEHVKQTKAARRCELQLYLEEDFHPRVPDFDILKW